MTFYQEIEKLLQTNQIQTKDQLHKVKTKLCKKYNIKEIPSNTTILSHLPETLIQEPHILLLLQRKPMRTISGVATVAVMTSPWECPHGTCIPCPGGPQNNTAQSYTGQEPAALRAAIHHFDPYQQTHNRLKQLQTIGHPVDKIDLILMGGTFTSRPPEYQQWFIKRCFDALNDKTTQNLKTAQKTNEQAPSRCIGLTIETRPDWLRLQHLDNILEYGATRIELGVQTIDDNLLYQMNRGHTVTDTILATQIAKDTGLKICYHIMPGLPGSNTTYDLTLFKQLFNDQRFKPDMIKIYPVLTIKNTKLYDLWKQNQYQPLNTIKAAQLIAKMKQRIPEWVRIQRIQRDIPAQLISSGVTKSNLRQLVESELQKHGQQCRCIRCREIGHKLLQDKIKKDQLTPKLNIQKYKASNGDELFLSYEDTQQDAIIAYLRLRHITNPYRPEFNEKPSMIIREVKVLGKEVALGEREPDNFQHKGFGKKLIKHAEKIVLEEFDIKNLFILSGVGVKPYYRRLGYQDTGIYLQKTIT